MANGGDPFCGLGVPVATDTPADTTQQSLVAGPTHWTWHPHIKQWQPEPFASFYAFNSDVVRYEADTVSQRDGTYMGGEGNVIANYQGGSEATSRLVAFLRRGELLQLPIDELSRFDAVAFPNADSCQSSESETNALAIQTTGSATFEQNFPGGAVYVGTGYRDSCAKQRNEVFAFSDTLIIRWLFNAHALVNVGPLTGFALAANKDLLLFTVDRIDPSDDSLFALDVNTGGIAWSVNSSRILAPPLVHGDRVYTVNLSGQFTATALGDGHTIWTFSTAMPVTRPMTLRVVGGKVMLYSIDYIGELRAVADRGDHAEPISLFKLPDIAPSGSTSPTGVFPVTNILPFAGGHAIVGADDGWLYAVDFLKGEVNGKVEVSDGDPVNKWLLARAPGLPGEDYWSVIAKAGSKISRFCTSLEWSSRIYVDGFDGLEPTAANPEGNVVAQ